jgi:DnaK suppressor protein
MSSNSKALTPAFLRRQASLLETLLNEYRNRLYQLRTELSRSNIVREVMGDYIDRAFVEEARAANVQEINYSQSLIDQLQKALSLIKKALEGERGNSEEYGKCQECREPIPLKRLMAIPWALLCAYCQQEQEKKL